MPDMEKIMHPKKKMKQNFRDKTTPVWYNLYHNKRTTTECWNCRQWKQNEPREKSRLGKIRQKSVV